MFIRGIYDPVYVAPPFAEKMSARGALGRACLERYRLHLEKLASGFASVTTASDVIGAWNGYGRPSGQT